jgi:hypothetical protein
VYVTEKTLAGFFVKIAEQEKMIRDDPSARSTKILRQVFGSRNWSWNVNDWQMEFSAV